ncbi:MAG: class I SAM-dependent methyltransferase [Deltaproteobacteria bacterium]
MKEGRPSRTAEQVALTRALATADGPNDRICDDPMAAAYLGPLARAALLAASVGPARLAWQLSHRLTSFSGPELFVPARTAFIDAALVRASARGLEQLVVLGAGYDSRAERFAGSLSGVRVFELDFPATQERKLRLRPRVPGVTYLPIDLAREPFEAPLCAAGFEPAKRSAFLWEGVIYYLDRTAAAGVVTEIRRLLRPGGSLFLDCFVEPPPLGLAYQLAFKAALRYVELVGEPVRTTFAPAEIRPFFERPGFRIADQADADELSRRYLRGAWSGLRLFPVWSCLDLEVV